MQYLENIKRVTWSKAAVEKVTKNEAALKNVLSDFMFNVSKDELLRVKLKLSTTEL